MVGGRGKQVDRRKVFSRLFEISPQFAMVVKSLHRNGPYADSGHI